MGLRIGSQATIFGLASRLTQVNNALERSYMRLATGKAYAGAGDGGSKVAMAARLKARIASIDAAGGSLQDGVSIVKTADAGLAEIEDSLVRMREIGIEAQNGSLTSAELTALQTEFAALSTAVDAVADGTAFNGTDLLNSTSTVTLVSGPDSGDTQILTLTDNNVAAAGLNISGLDVTTGAAAAVASIDAALSEVGSNRATMSAYATQFDATYNALTAQSEAMSSTLSRIEDVDVALETALLTKNSIIQQAGLAVLAQATVQSQSLLSLLSF